MNRRFVRRVTRETHDRDAVANFSEVRSGAVEFDDSALCFAVNCIGLEPFAVAQVARFNRRSRLPSSVQHRRRFY